MTITFPYLEMLGQVGLTSDTTVVLWNRFA